MEMSEGVKKSLSHRFEEMGLELTAFNFESFSLPPALEKALDENTRLGMMRQNIDIYTRLAQADALREAAKNPGSAGGTMGAGIGMGIGMNMGKMFADMNAAPAASARQEAAQGGRKCAKCGAALTPNAKFCPECGAKAEASGFCPACGAKLPAGSKFCPECGSKL